MTFVGFNDLNVVILYPSVGIEVVTEVGACDWLTHLALHLSLVSFFNSSTGVRITRQETKGYIPMRLTIAIDILHAQNNVFGWRYAGNPRDQTIATEGDCSDGRGSSNNNDITRRNWSVEGKDSVISSSSTIFHAGSSS